MKITKQRLKQIIKEELKLLAEAEETYDPMTWKKHLGREEPYGSEEEPAGEFEGETEGEAYTGASFEKSLKNLSRLAYQTVETDEDPTSLLALLGDGYRMHGMDMVHLLVQRSAEAIKSSGKTGFYGPMLDKWRELSAAHDKATPY